MPVYQAERGRERESREHGRDHARALGEQGLHIVREADRRAEELEVELEKAKRQEERDRLRGIVDAASVRPAPGTSEMLSRPLTVGTCAGVDLKGKLRAVDTYDLVGMAPVHLKKGEGNGM